VAEVRALAQSFDWPNLTLHVAPANRGLRQSIMAGVSELVERYGTAIVVEDDLLLAPPALEYFAAGLAAFEDDARVLAICGYTYRSNRPAGRKAFFLPFASSWGWATWRRAWEPFVAEVETLPALARDPAFLRRFDRQGIIAASTMLKAQHEGLIDSWAILWNAHLTRRGGMALFPAETMLLNGGFAAPGATHGGRGNPINLALRHLNRGRRLASGFTLHEHARVSEAMRRRIAGTLEARLHRLSARLGYWRRRVNRLRGPG
jgi:hypothetical protein